MSQFKVYFSKTAARCSFNCANAVAVTTAIHKIGSTLATVLTSQRDNMPVFGWWTCRYFLREPIKCVYPKCFVLHGFGWDCPFLIPGGLLSHLVKSAQACWDCNVGKSCRVAPKRKLEFLHIDQMRRRCFGTLTATSEIWRSCSCLLMCNEGRKRWRWRIRAVWGTSRGLEGLRWKGDEKRTFIKNYLNFTNK